MQPKRISWIDVARGIGIILVIHGHSLSSESYRHLIYAFHMPLFFFISGLVFNYIRNDNLGLVIKKSAKGILVPYVGFALFTYLIWLFQNNAFLSFDFSAFLNHMTGIIYGNSNRLFFNIVLWFLPVLFVTKVLFSFISKLKSEKIIAITLFIFSLIGYLISVISPDIRLPFGVETALTAVVFFGAGSLLVTNPHPKLNDFVLRNKIILFAAASLISGIFAVVNYQNYGQQIDLRLLHYGNYFYFYIAAISGIVATLILGRIINTNRVLEYIGKYTLALFIFHPVVLFYANKILAIFISMRVVDDIRDIYLSPFFTLISIGVILGVYYLGRRTGIYRLSKKLIRI